MATPRAGKQAERSSAKALVGHVIVGHDCVLLGAPLADAQRHVEEEEEEEDCNAHPCECHKLAAEAYLLRPLCFVARARRPPTRSPPAEVASALSLGIIVR